MYAGDGNYTFLFMNTAGMGGFAQLVYECTGCCQRVYISTFTAPPTFVYPRPGLAPCLSAIDSPDVLRFFFGFQFSTPLSSYTAFKKLCRGQGHTSWLTPPQFQQLRVKLHAILSRAARRQCLYAIEHMKRAHARTGLAVIGADGVYLIRGHDSPHMTGVVYDHVSQLMLSVIHASRDRNLDESRYLTAKVDCSSKTMEKEVTCANLEYLVALGCPMTHGVFDGDSAIKSAVLTVVMALIIVQCFNHYLKNRTKDILTAIAAKIPTALSAKAPGRLDSENHCVCQGTTHVRTATATKVKCGCPNDSLATKLQAQIHAAAISAGDNLTLFVSLLQQLKQHVAGDHSTCVFHPKLKCKSCTPKCATKSCSCGKCKEGEGRLCWGQVSEPTCPDAVPWFNKYGNVTCPFHLFEVRNILDIIIAAAPALILPQLGGKQHTCLEESKNMDIQRARIKGIAMGWLWYALCTIIGVLNGNAVALARAMKSENPACEPSSYLYKIDAMLEFTGAPMSQEQQTMELEEHRRREQVSAQGKTEAARVRRVQQETKARKLRALRTKSAQSAADAEGDTGEYGSHDFCSELTQDAQPHLLTGGPVVAAPAPAVGGAAPAVTKAATCGGQRGEMVIPGFPCFIAGIDTEADSVGGSYTEGMTDFAVIANWYTKEGICKEVPPRKFLTVMRSTGVNRWSDWAVGNKHLTDEQLRNGQTEKDAMTAFHEFLVELREEGEEGRNFVYIAGHNVDSFDLPHINRAFGRAGLTLDGVVDGVVDTLRLSRMYINWTEVAAMPKLPPTTSMLLVGPAVLAEEEESSEHEDENEGGMQATSVTPLTAVDATDFSTLGAAIKRGKVAGNKVAIKVEQHNLGNCHARLFGVGLGDHAHEASADAYAVVAILSHPAVWPLLVDEEVWRPVSSIVKHADGLYAAEINRVRGWRREYRPVCDHGVMLTTVVAVHEELERAMFTDGHKVVFKCRMRFKPCRDPVEEVTYPGYVVTAATKVPRSGSKVSTAVPKGTAGACECSSMCVRGCPCKNAGQRCGTSCRNHGRASCKCKNLASGTGGGSSGGSGASSGSSAPRARASKGRGSASASDSDSDSEGDSDDSEGEGDSDDVSDGGGGEDEDELECQWPPDSRLATAADLVPETRVHGRWLGERQTYPGAIEAILRVGTGRGSAHTVYRVRYDDGDVEDVADLSLIQLDTSKAR